MGRDTRMPNAFDDSVPPADDALRAMIQRRTSLLGPAYRLFYQEPLHLVKGDGIWLYASDGRPYLDAYNNVASVGHCHPRVVEAIARQAATLNTHTRYLHEGVLELAERLLATLPDTLAHMMFTCTGSEANDLAYRLALSFTEGTGILVTENAYHGLTHAIAKISPSVGIDQAGSEHVRMIPAPKPRGVRDQQGIDFSHAVSGAIEDMVAHGIKPAAMFLDTVFASDGIFTDPPGMLEEGVARWRAAGGLFVADEVQAGLARTGEAMWGFQRHGLIPDLVTIGKPLGNGHPVAAVAVRADVAERFGRATRYFNTFGGNPVSAAAALATLAVIEDENLQANSLKIGRELRRNLSDLSSAFTIVGAVRGSGLLVGVDIVSDDSLRAPDPVTAARIVNDMRRGGILISATGPFGHVLKIRPPLCLDAAHAALIADVLHSVLAKL
jgi:4-aminobutyrate aminotransferase-like enzyme